MIGEIFSSLFGGNQQANAANNAQALEAKYQQEALDFQKQEWQQQQGNMAPWIQQGQGAINTLGNLQNEGLQGQGPLAPWTQQFQAPTLQQAQNEPGYQFALSQGTQALDRSAAASGNLLTGNTGEALQQYGQNLGEENYQNVYNRSLQQYQQAYNQYEQGQANTFNRYASLAGLGQTVASQLGNQGQAAAGNVGNLYLTGGAQQAQQINNAAYQQASGYNTAAGLAAGGTNNLLQYAMMSGLG